jgi:hypothetical protein
MWDEPFHRQPSKVQEVLRQHGITGPQELGEFAGRKVESAPLTGADLHSQLGFRVGGPKGDLNSPYYDIAAAQVLREAGVPGIRYLDQHSRWATDMKMGEAAPRTHNYVVFDDSLIDIIRKYGLAGLIAGGAAHFTAPADDAHGMARGGAAPADDASALSDEDRAHIGRAWRELIEDRAHQGRMHYTMPPVAGMAPPGSFRIPRDIFEKLGDGDLKTGGAVVHGMFGIEDDPADPTIIHPHVVRIIGNGSLAAGRKMLERFVARVRRQSREGVVLEHDGLQHDDGHHGWGVARQ